MTPQQFYAKYNGKVVDYDGAYGPQCVDAFKIWCSENSVPVKAAPNNYADGYWYYRDQLGYATYFSYITDPKDFQQGDWCLWARGSRSHSQSHIAMLIYLDGQPAEFSENQGGNGGFCLKYTDFSDALGALRWKGYERMEIEKGFHSLTWNGIKVDILRATYANGYRLHLLSAGGPFALKDLMEFDSDRLAIVGAVNANYFNMSTGEHLGVEGDGYVRGYFQAPKAAGVLAYYINNQDEIGAHDESSFYLGQDQIKVAFAPYSVLIHQEQVTDMHSTAFGSKDLVKNTQTAVMRIGEDWTIAIFSECYPTDVLKFAQEVGANELALMDSGGSSQMFECATTGKRKEIRHTSRRLPNVIALAKEIAGADSEPIPEDPAEPEPEPTPEPDEPGIEPEHPTGWTNELFDAMRYLAEIGLPALSVLIATVGQITGLPHADKIAAVIMAISVFVGSLVGIKRKQYTEARDE